MRRKFLLLLVSLSFVFQFNCTKTESTIINNNLNTTNTNVIQNISKALDKDTIEALVRILSKKDINQEKLEAEIKNLKLTLEQKKEILDNFKLGNYIVQEKSNAISNSPTSTPIESNTPSVIPKETTKIETEKEIEETSSGKDDSTSTETSHSSKEIEISPSPEIEESEKPDEEKKEDEKEINKNTTILK